MNYENFIRVLTYIEQHPEEWDQFEPSTRYDKACCFLGHAKRIADIRWWLSTFGAGRSALETSEAMTEWLFAADRTLDDFRRIHLVACRANYAKVKTSGRTQPGAKAYFYATGTTTPQDTFTDATLLTPNANPVVADAGGVFPQEGEA